MSRDVTILEYLPGLLMTGQEARNNTLALKAMLAKNNIKSICGAAVMRVSEEGVIYRKDGAEHVVECDSVVTAVGFVSNSELAAELEEKGCQVTVIGDAKAPRKIINAVKEGLFAALDM